MGGPKIIQISNIPIQVTKDQMYAMFECIGDIEDIQLYPKKRSTSFHSRICFIKFLSSKSVELAYYLNDTHLMDRLLQISPFYKGKRDEIPSEKKALEMLMNDNCHMNSNVVEREGELMSDIEKVALELQRNGLPPYPSLPFNCNASQVEEIRRTIVVSNLDESISGQQILDHFSKVGEVKYVRFCKRNSDGQFCCLVEFSKYESIVPSLKLNNSEIVEGRKIKVYHSVHAIEKSMDVIFNGVVINRLASSLIEAACQEALGEKNSDVGQDCGQRSPFRKRSRDDSLSSRSSDEHRKHKHKRHRQRSRDRQPKYSHRTRRSRSQERRRYESRENRKLSYDKSWRGSRRSRSRERISYHEKSESKNRSSIRERKHRERNLKERSKSSSRERAKSRSRERTRSRSRSISKSNRNKKRSSEKYSRERRSHSYKK